MVVRPFASISNGSINAPGRARKSVCSGLQEKITVASVFFSSGRFATKVRKNGHGLGARVAGSVSLGAVSDRVPRWPKDCAREFAVGFVRLFYL